MQIGINLASVAGFDGDSGLRAYLDLAEHAEQLEFDSVWVPDQHALGGQDHAAVPEPLTLLSALAQATRRIEIGTLDLAVPLRHPLMTAKMLSTADRLSGGRVIFSAGIGVTTEDFGAVGVSGLFEEREAVTDDYLRAIKEAWLNTGPSRYTGDHVRFAEIGTFPHPVRQPHIPIWISASDAASLRRAVRLGSGFVSNAPDMDTFAQQRAEARRLAEQDRRDPDEITCALATTISFEAGASDPNQTLLSGSPTQLRDRLHQLREVGVQHLIATVAVPGERPLKTMMDAVQALAELLPAMHAAAAGGAA